VDYALLEAQERERIGGESDALANAANFAAFVFCEMASPSALPPVAGLREG
jgi:hypothetical protein